jgi:transcriptional regulator with XRE-family HTH domain
MTFDHGAAPDGGFRVRMSMLESLVGNWSELARKAGLSRRVLDKYRNGESDPSRARLVALAQAAGVRVEWLATGEGAMLKGDPLAGALATPMGIDRELLALVHKGVVEVYLAENAGNGLDSLAGEVARIYEELIVAFDSSEERRSGLKLALHQLRTSLRASAGGG